tara:strand:- start:6337 stop:8307 length:1971 start_codon:yes stop_codon:yes gene_type:complete
MEAQNKVASGVNMKRTHCKKLFALFVFTSLLISGCATRSTAPAASDEQIEVAPSLAPHKVEHPIGQLILANLAYYRDDKASALDYYYRLSQSSESPLIHARVLSLANQLSDYEKIKESSYYWIQQHPSNHTAFRSALHAHLALNELDEAANLWLERYQQSEPPLSANTSFQLLVYLQKNAPVLALHQVVEMMATRLPQEPRIQLLHAAVLYDEDKLTQAQTAIEKAYLAIPDNDTIIKLKAWIHHKQGQLKALDEFFVSVHQRLPHHIDLMSFMLNMWIDLHTYELAFGYARLAVNNNPEVAGLDYLFAKAAFYSGHTTDALPVFKELTQHKRLSNDANYFLGKILQEQHQCENATRYLNNVDSGQYHWQAIYAKALCLSEQNNLEGAISLLEKHRRDFPAARLYSLSKQAELLVAHHQPARALQTMRDGLDYSENDLPLWVLYFETMAAYDTQQQVVSSLTALKNKFAPEAYYSLLNYCSHVITQPGPFASLATIYDSLIAREPNNLELRYSKALAAEFAGEHAIVDQEFQYILDLVPNHSSALNAYGYSLVERRQRLEEARDYIHKALEIKPGDPAIVDSKGWLHYRLGELELANDYLETAYRLSGDGEIALHWGEVLWKLGHKEDAQQLWEQALKINPNHPGLRNALRQLKSS